LFVQILGLSIMLWIRFRLRNHNTTLRDWAHAGFLSISGIFWI
jgi:hypothetical protein